MFFYCVCGGWFHVSNECFLVEGHCSKISSGYHKISLTVESCDMATNFVYTSTGLSLYTNRVIIDEFRVGSLITGGLYTL